MFKKSVLILLVILMISIFTGIAVGEEKTTGYLHVLYKSPECGMGKPHVFSCYAPFEIVGNKIIGSFEISEDDNLPLLPLPDKREASDFRQQIIDYAYKCPPVDERCPPPDVNGQLIVHKVSGRVVKTKGKKMLHFFIRLSIPYCVINVCGQEFDRSMEAWNDDFMAPFQDGYRTERGDKALFDYVVYLEPYRK